MIGQVELKRELGMLIENNQLPKFIILEGKVGSGKKLMCKEIFKLSNAQNIYMLPDVKVDTIRQMIEDAYTVKEPTLMVIPDADTMSISAKNAILKVVEEPPKNIVFIMTLQDINNTLETIRSRATVFKMNIYKPKELEEYCRQIGITDDIDLYVEFCETPGHIDIFKRLNPREFYEFTKLVFDNIAEVQPANAFKSSNKLALKANSEGYDLELFWKIFIKLCLESNSPKTIPGIMITSQYLRKLNRLNLNKQHCYDAWVFDIREAWY